MIDTAETFSHLTLVEMLRLMLDRKPPDERKQKKRRGRLTHRFVGMGGEMRIGGRPCLNTKTAFRTNLGNVKVSYALITTARQAAHANRLNQQLYGVASIGPES